jgi:hypothetical protein
MNDECRKENLIHHYLIGVSSKKSRFVLEAAFFYL